MIAPAGRQPYPGLRSFRRDETDLFFGRETCVDQMIDRLGGERFLAVLGASGSGKSSLVRTGLLDGLELGYLREAGPAWRIFEMTPGGAPMRNLARALTGSDASEVEVDLMRAFLSRGPRSLGAWRNEANLAADENVLLLVDQFEELFRYRTYEDRQEVERFVALLLNGAKSATSPIYVVLTMRSEYLGACALIDGLAEAMNRGQYLTPRMTRAQCRDAIEGPAGVCSFALEPALVMRILNDLSDFAPWEDQATDRSSQSDRLIRRADQLPLLQHALNRLWMMAAADSSGVVLKLADYVEIGGLRGAISRHGEEVVAGLGADRAAIAEKVFRALTDGPNIADAVRRPTRIADLAASCGVSEAEVCATVEPFRLQGCSFLTPADDVRLTSDTFIDISHESLIRQWSRLSDWLRAEVRSAEAIRRIAAAAARYERGEGEFLQGLDLANLVQWRRETLPTAAWAQRYIENPTKALEFLENSRLSAAQARRRDLIVRVAGAATILLFLIGSLFFVALHSADKAQEAALSTQRDLAEIARADAEGLRRAAEAAQGREQTERERAEAARQHADDVVNQARSAFIKIALAQAGEFHGNADYERAGDFLASLVGLARRSDGGMIPDFFGLLKPRLAEQFAARTAFPENAKAQLAEGRTELKLDRSGRFDAQSWSRGRVVLIDRRTGLRTGDFGLENDVSVSTDAVHFVSQDGRAMIVVGDGGGLYLWSAGQTTAVFVPDADWRGRKAFSYAYDPESGTIASLYCEWNTRFLATVSRDGNVRTKPTPLFEIAKKLGGSFPASMSRCDNGATQGARSDDSASDAEMVDKRTSLIAAKSDEVVLSFAIRAAPAGQDASTSDAPPVVGLAALRSATWDGRWLVAPGRLEEWSEGAGQLSLVASLPSDVCGKSATTASLAQPAQGAENSTDCLLGFDPRARALIGDPVPLPYSARPDAEQAGVLWSDAGPAWRVAGAAEGESLATLVGWSRDANKIGLIGDENAQLIGRDEQGVVLVAKPDNKAWGSPLFEKAVRFSRPNAAQDDRPLDDALPQMAASSSGKVLLLTAPNEKDWRVWLSAAGLPKSPKITIIEGNADCKRPVSLSADAPPALNKEPAAKAGSQADASGADKPSSNPAAEITDLTSYGAHDDMEFLALVDEGDKRATFWDARIQDGAEGPQISLSCIGKFAQPGAFYPDDTPFHQARLSGGRFLWRDNDDKLFVVSLVAGDGGAAPRLGPLEPLGLTASAVKAVTPLADGSIAEIDADGSLGVHEYRAGKWVRSEARSIPRLVGNTGESRRYALAARGNRLLVANKAGGDWWRAFLVDVTNDPRIVAAGMLPNLSRRAEISLVDSDGTIAAADDGRIAYWRLPQLPGDDTAARLIEASGDASHIERLDLVDMGQFVLGGGLPAPLASLAAPGDEARVACELAFVAALKSKGGDKEEESREVARNACRSGSEQNFAAALLAPPTDETAGKKDGDFAPSFARNWPAVLSTLFDSAATGDPLALRIALDRDLRATRNDDDDSAAVRLADALQKEYEDFDSRFVDARGNSGAAPRPPDPSSADPVEHLRLAARALSEGGAGDSAETALAELIESERLIATAGLDVRAVSARRVALARRLPANRAAEASAKAQTWRARAGFYSAPTPSTPATPPERAIKDIDDLERAETAVKAPGRFNALKLVLLDDLSRLASNVSDASNYRLRQAELLLADQGDIATSDARSTIAGLLNLTNPLNAELSARLAVRNVELLQRDDGGALSDGAKGYRDAIADLTRRFDALPVERRKEIANRISLNPMAFSYGSVKGQDLEASNDIKVALSAQLALIERLLQEAPGSLALLNARGVTHFWLGVRQDDDSFYMADATAKSAAKQQFQREATTAVNDLASTGGDPKRHFMSADASRWWAYENVGPEYDRQRQSSLDTYNQLIVEARNSGLAFGTTMLIFADVAHIAKDQLDAAGAFAAKTESNWPPDSNSEADELGVMLKAAHIATTWRMDADRNAAFGAASFKPGDYVLRTLSYVLGRVAGREQARSHPGYQPSECEQRVSAPWDGERRAAGVGISEIDVSRSISACERENALTPNDAHINFLLGRILPQDPSRLKEGLQALQSAALAEYPGGWNNLSYYADEFKLGSELSNSLAYGMAQRVLLASFPVLFPRLQALSLDKTQSVATRDFAQLAADAGSASAHLALAGLASDAADALFHKLAARKLAGNSQMARDEAALFDSAEDERAALKDSPAGLLLDSRLAAIDGSLAPLPKDIVQQIVDAASRKSR